MSSIDRLCIDAGTVAYDAYFVQAQDAAPTPMAQEACFESLPPSPKNPTIASTTDGGAQGTTTSAELFSLVSGVKSLKLSKKRVFETLSASLIRKIGTYLCTKERLTFGLTCKWIMNECFAHMFLDDAVSTACALEKTKGVLPKHLRPVAHSICFLDFSNVALTKELAQVIADKFVKLEKLALGWTVTDEAFDVFEAAFKTKLVELRCDLPAAHLARLASFSSLRILNVSGAHADDKVLQAFEESPLKKKLVDFSLASCRHVASSGFAKLASFSALQRLDLSFTQANDAVISAFVESALKTTLVELRLGFCGALSPNGLKKLASFTVHTLDLAYTNTNDEVLQAFEGSALKATLVWFCLHMCSALSPDGLKLLAGFDSLQSLDLSNTKTNSEVLQAFDESGLTKRLHTLQHSAAE